MGERNADTAVGSVQRQIGKRKRVIPIQSNGVAAKNVEKGCIKQLLRNLAKVEGGNNWVKTAIASLGFTNQMEAKFT